MKRFFTGLFWGTMTIVATALEPADFAQAQLKNAIPGTIVLCGSDGWLFSRNELEHLGRGELAGGEITRHSQAKRNPDPVPAITGFQQELNALGIRLLVVPVPPKLAVRPFGELKAGEAMKYLKPFYQELRNHGVEVVDLSDDFRAAKEPVYCMTDAHWSPAGLELAASKIANLAGFHGNTPIDAVSVKAEISGDLARSAKLDAKETLTFSVVDDPVFDENSPILLLSDSHGLIFSAGGDMLMENAGFGEALARHLSSRIDRIAVKGSAASAVRLDLYRKAAKNPDWIKNKKLIIWCFSSREFTEALGGWPVVPVIKK